MDYLLLFHITVSSNTNEILLYGIVSLPFLSIATIIKLAITPKYAM